MPPPPGYLFIILGERGRVAVAIRPRRRENSLSAGSPSYDKIGDMFVGICLDDPTSRKGHRALSRLNVIRPHFAADPVRAIPIQKVHNPFVADKHIIEEDIGEGGDGSGEDLLI